jgi:hypothetical protein
VRGLTTPVRVPELRITRQDHPALRQIPSARRHPSIRDTFPMDPHLSPDGALNTAVRYPGDPTPILPPGSACARRRPIGRWTTREVENVLGIIVSIGSVFAGVLVT